MMNHVWTVSTLQSQRYPRYRTGTSHDESPFRIGIQTRSSNVKNIQCKATVLANENTINFVSSQFALICDESFVCERYPQESKAVKRTGSVSQPVTRQANTTHGSHVKHTKNVSKINNPEKLHTEISQTSLESAHQNDRSHFLISNTPEADIYVAHGQLRNKFENLKTVTYNCKNIKTSGGSINELQIRCYSSVTREIAFSV